MLLQRWRHAGLALVAALWCAAAGHAAHAADDGRFEVRNAFVELKDDVWLLDVRLDLALADAARQAFEDGVPLVLELEAEASVERRFLPDETVASVTRRWQLAYDAIAERHVITDTTSGENVSHPTPEEAFDAFARLSGIEIADSPRLRPGGRFGMRVRATVDIGELPAAIKFLLFWRSWSRSTDWYEWDVRP